MSNRKYRISASDESARAAIEESTRAAVEQGAQDLIARILAKGGEPAKRLEALLQAEFDRRGGRQIDLQMEALLLVIEEARLDRALDIKHKQALLESKPGEEPEQPKRRVVSAPTLCNASRQLTALRAERDALQRRCEIVVAIGLMERREERASEPRAQAGSSTESEPRVRKAAASQAEGSGAPGVTPATAAVA